MFPFTFFDYQIYDSRFENNFIKQKKMKQIFLILILALHGLLTVSCIDVPAQRLGFNSTFGKNSNGLTIARIGNFTDYVYLEGNVKIEEGIVEIILLNPEEEIVFRCCLENSGNTQIFQRFQASTGFWKLKYISKDATGLIDLHVRF